jgi:hypothetical protein
MMRLRNIGSFGRCEEHMLLKARAFSSLFRSANCSVKREALPQAIKRDSLTRFIEPFYDYRIDFYPYHIKFVNEINSLFT